MNKIATLIINLITLIFGVIAISFVTNFWIGSQEQHETILKDSSTEFIIGKISLNLFLGVVILLVLFFLLRIGNWLSSENQKVEVKKVLIINAIVLTISSILIVFLHY